MEKKCFMGVAQIVLDDLDLSNIVIAWYKLFHHTSLVALPTNQPTNPSRNAMRDQMIIQSGSFG